jgi:hypothetical protein
VFNAVLKFADINGKTVAEKRDILNQLLPHIRFTLCSPKFLSTTNPQLTRPACVRARVVGVCVCRELIVDRSVSCCVVLQSKRLRPTRT